MSILYFDCAMGAAGDMLTSALLELLPDPDAFVEQLNEIGLDGIRFQAVPSEKCGIRGTHMRVMIHGETEEDKMRTHEHGEAVSLSHAHEQGDSVSEHHDHDHHHDHDAAGHLHDHHHHEHDADHPHDHEHHEHGHSQDHPHRKLSDIDSIVSSLKISDIVKEDILSVYRLIAEAESSVHGEPVTQIHFHEVGDLDAVADVTAVCMLIRELSPDRIVCSPVHVGSGTVHCAHGVLPVPAPATAYLLKNIPVYSGAVRGELCTPTGAALLKYFADEFAQMPLMEIRKIGYGMGTKDFETANCIRAFLGEEAGDNRDHVYQLSCNIDDMTGEEIGFAVGKLIELGARDVFTVPVMMKKNRPGTLLNVICSKTDREKFAAAIFSLTSTIGIREAEFNRYVLKRREETVSTQYGEIRKKISEGYGTLKEKYEYEDLAGIAEEKGVSIAEIRKWIKDS